MQSGVFLHMKSKATPHTNLDSLHPSIAAEWDKLVAEYICRTCSSFSLHWQAVAKKNEVEIECRWAAKSPTHTNQHATMSFN
jgi:hypothetical protein